MKQNIKVAIKSCAKYSDRRIAQRTTWLQELDEDFFFLVGGLPTAEQDILWCQVSDAFSDIAPKVLLACKYALEENVTNLFVCDDDTYVCPERLMKSGFWHADYLGFLRTYGTQYNNDVPYAQGAAYWMSERAMEWVVRNESLMRPGIIDDGAVGHCLIDRVQFVHDRRYSPGPVPTNILATNNLISAHKCLPQQMHAAHEAWRNSLKVQIGGSNG